MYMIFSMILKKNRTAEYKKKVFKNLIGFESKLKPVWNVICTLQMSFSATCRFYKKKI